MKATYTSILAVASMAAASCTSIKPETDTQTKIQQGVPGGTVVQTSRIEATVTAIDTAKRKVTLVTRKGEKFKVTAGPEVDNFDQVRVGDQLKVTYTEELIVRMAKPGEKTEDSGEAEFDIAPRNAKPGLKTSETYQVTATVAAIDMKKRQATLSFADGYTKTFKVRPDVDLTKRKVGEKVVIRTSETFAIKLEKP
jgi:hypothetical protein